MQWLEQILPQHAQLQERLPGVKPQLLAPIVGADQVDERARAAKAVAQLPGVAGFALCGFGMGETLEQQPALLQAAVQHLPADKPRLIGGLVRDSTALRPRALHCDYV